MGSCPACSLEVSASCPGLLCRPRLARHFPRHLLVTHVRRAKGGCGLPRSSRIRATSTSTFKATLVSAGTAKISSCPARIDGGISASVPADQPWPCGDPQVTGFGARSRLISRRGSLCALRAPLGRNGSLDPSQSTSEKKPRFRSGNEARPMAVVLVRLC